MRCSNLTLANLHSRSAVGMPATSLLALPVRAFETAIAVLKPTVSVPASRPSSRTLTSERLSKPSGPQVSKEQSPMADKANKGARAEEAIRNVFRHAGYYVVRAIPYTFQGREVTDIDLWLYGKTGLFRERINVDIKNKKTPQAIERFFWALGVMQVLRLERCIVVTTERNSAVVEFGRRSNVTVIDGQFLQDAQAKPDPDRLSEEDLLAAIRPVNAEELGKELQGRYLAAKARLLTQMTYDGCNLHLLDIKNALKTCWPYLALKKCPSRSSMRYELRCWLRRLLWPRWNSQTMSNGRMPSSQGFGMERQGATA